MATPSGQSETYRCTDTHPFWMEKGGDDGEGGFLAARCLRAGDQLRLGDGSPAYVTGVEATGIIEPVYNFSVDGWQTYHVGELGVWVHNPCPDVLERFARELGEGGIHDVVMADLQRGGTLKRLDITNANNRAPAFENWLGVEGRGVRIHGDGSVEYYARSIGDYNDVSIFYRRGEHGKYHPDFSAYVRSERTVVMRGKRDADIRRADELEGIDLRYRQAEDLTWHHHQDRQTMQLIPRAIHDAFTHTGGDAYARGFGAIR